MQHDWPGQTGQSSVEERAPAILPIASRKMNTNDMKEQVGSAVSSCLCRIAGGDEANRPIRPSSSKRSSHSTDECEWLEQLKEIAFSTVSLPNGWCSVGREDANFLGGKPHDVEVRAALTLYHRVRCAEKQVPTKRKKSGGKLAESKPIELISDMGTVRSFDSPVSLAKLLTKELEQELFRISIPFASIRQSSSGIICLVSKLRADQLAAADRLPCQHCLQWFKGKKGLWWHQLAAHSVEYPEATEVADNSKAVVRYDEGHPNKRHAITTSQVLNKQISSTSEELDAFELTRRGKIGPLRQLILGGFNPSTSLDRNGASLLHWSAGTGQLKIVKFLLEECNCDPNTRQKGKRSFNLRTPLHWSARNGHLPVVEYLVLHCKANIDAATQDGTTAFCWASWQGHIRVMKFLYNNGCDPHVKNCFGCNAVLWCAQGKGDQDTLAWLRDVDCSFECVNSNGHSCLHKSAQRGSRILCEWLVYSLLFGDGGERQYLIQPDTEGNCPSDLSRVEGHEDLAEWLSMQECDYAKRMQKNNLPTWLENPAAASPGVQRMARCLQDNIPTPEECIPVHENMADID